MLVVPEDCINLHTLKNCLRVLLEVRLNVGAEIFPSGALTGLSTSSPTESIKNIIGCLDKHRGSEESRAGAGLKNKVRLLHEASLRLEEVVLQSTV